jgi:DNA-binding MarR family transcriptional regulator
VAGTFLTHQARVLLAIANDCNIRMRDLANRVGLTERAVYDAIHDLIAAGYLEVERVGRRNCYRLILEPGEDGEGEVESVTELARLLSGERSAGESV